MTIKFFREQDDRAIHEMLAELRRPVHLVLGTAPGDMYSDITHALLDQLVSLHADLHLATLDERADGELTALLGLDRRPVILVLNSDQTAYRIRFYGLPSGATFAALLEAVLIVGTAPGDLSPELRAFLARLSTPIHLQVFVTASDDACPPAIALAYRLANASPYIIAEAIEILAFPQLAQQYGVRQTPTTILNQHLSVVGSVSEAELLGYLYLAKLSGY